MRFIVEDEHEEPYAGYVTAKVEDDHGQLKCEVHVDLDVLEALDDAVTDADSWEGVEKVARAYADLFQQDGEAAYGRPD